MPQKTFDRVDISTPIASLIASKNEKLFRLANFVPYAKEVLRAYVSSFGGKLKMETTRSSGIFTTSINIAVNDYIIERNYSTDNQEKAASDVINELMFRQFISFPMVIAPTSGYYYPYSRFYLLS